MLSALICGALLYMVVIPAFTAGITGSQHAYPNQQQKAWALAACALLCERNGEKYDSLGGMKVTTAKVSRYKKLLAHWRDVKSRKELLETLRWLDQGGGHRAEFAKLGTHVAAMSDEAFSAFAKEYNGSENDQHRLEMARQYYTKLGKKSLLSWDYMRYISFCLWGYYAGYLNENEAWEKIMPAAIKLQAAYTSWDDLGENYLIGLEYWSSNEARIELPLCTAIFDKLSTDCGSPWATLRWDMNLKSEAEKNQQRPVPHHTDENQ